MYYGIHRWKLKEGMHDYFLQEWERVTQHIYEEHGSQGALLLEMEDGTISSIAKWPDKQSRTRCWSILDKDEAILRISEKCVAEKFPDRFGTELSDLLKLEPHKK